MTRLAQAIFDEFLPGPLTLVLRKKEPSSFRLLSGETIGIRVPHQPLAVEIAEEFGPITATSGVRNVKPLARNLDMNVPGIWTVETSRT